MIHPDEVFPYYKIKHMRTNAQILILIFTLVIALSACDMRSATPHSPEDGTTEIPPSLQTTPTEKTDQPTATTDSSSFDTPSPEAIIGLTAELEITFVAARQDGPPGIFAIRLGCPDEDPPCIGAPQLLFADRLIDGLSETSWSPTGDQVVFDSRPGPNLYVSSADGSGMRNLTESLPKGIFPSWSPDGSQIAYTSCQDQPCRELSISLEDGLVSTLLEGASISGEMASVWAVDHLLLAFNAYPDESLDTLQVFVSNADGSELVQVTEGETDSYSRWISPDGQKVVYMGTFELNSGQKLFISDLEGNRHILIANPHGSLSDPAWSPTGGWIVFKRHTEEGGDDLFIIREDGTYLYQVTNSPDVWEGSPAWRVCFP